MFALNIPTSSNIAELLSQKAELEASLKKNQEGFNQDRHLFVDQVRQLIKTFNITRPEAFPPSKDKQASVDKDYSPDYFFRDPETGAEWDGKGKRPGYLSGKKKTEKFRIYHATGTNFAPVVKPSAAHAPLTAVPAEPPVATNTPAAQSLGVAPAYHHQSATTIAAVPVMVDQSTSAMQTNVSAEAAPISS